MIYTVRVYIEIDNELIIGDDAMTSFIEEAFEDYDLCIGEVVVLDIND